MSISIPMAIAAQNLELLANALSEEDINETLQKLFTETRLDLASACDRRVYFIELAKERIATFERLKKEFSLAQKRMEYALERIKENTISIMEAYKDIPYKGDLGRLRIQANAAKLVTAFTLDEYTARNIVDAQDIATHEINEKYYEAVTLYRLQIEVIKKALEDGESVPWAKLERGKHLRIDR